MVLPRFELALRRTLFYLTVVTVYLLFGAILFRHLPSITINKISSERAKRLDFERSEFLNVLWAEALARGEQEWSLFANHKLDTYERALLDATGVDETPQPIRSYSDAFHHSFLLITTIGGIDTDDLSTPAKLFSIAYAIVGIPLTLSLIAQSGKAISSIQNGPQLFLLTAFGVFVAAVIYDVVEQTPEDTPFTDAVFSIFLAITTIGEEDGRVPRLLLYLVAVVIMPAFNVVLDDLHKLFERQLQSLELTFCRQFAEWERCVSGEGNDNRIVEENEDLED